MIDGRFTMVGVDVSWISNHLLWSQCLSILIYIPTVQAAVYVESVTKSTPLLMPRLMRRGSASATVGAEFKDSIQFRAR